MAATGFLICLIELPRRRITSTCTEVGLAGIFKWNIKRPDSVMCNVIRTQMLATVQTDFATLIISATSDDPDVLRDSLSVRLVHACGRLPSGMSVGSTLILDAFLRSRTPVRDFRFSARIESVEDRGSPESGEHLEASGWQRGAGAMMLGTKDGESMADRMDDLRRICKQRRRSDHRRKRDWLDTERMLCEAARRIRSIGR